ncbi:NAD(P)-binding protein [Rickenella mellea]|uniref:NAD(P)-binding protein n=1 Tax=Rickenella mellea TaxID=50990 RepID=A0A4Y7QLU5_9AGAM|nr:NAD(P)-binding protein [Rickenella mellea]
MSSFDLDQLFNVQGKVILVTGGSRGIGKYISTGFVRNGAKVYISARSAKGCEATAKELNAIGPGRCIAIPADMQKVSEVDRLFNEIKLKEKVLHVLVNNAGTTWGEGIDEYPDSAFTKVLTLNVQRVFNLTQKCLPLLRAAATEGGKEGSTWKDPGRIINIGSVEGLSVPPHETYAYSASKAALHHLSRTMAGRLGWDGVTSNTIACGPFESKMMAYNLDNFREIITNSIPLTRIGTPEDVAGTALFLASRAGAYVNGATIALDGGSVVATNSLQSRAKL